MINQEIEEGELNTDDEQELEQTVNNLINNSNNIINNHINKRINTNEIKLDDNESGELSDDDDENYNANNITKKKTYNEINLDELNDRQNENPYDSEDETTIKLKMNALKSLLDKDASPNQSSMKKSKLKKAKKPINLGLKNKSLKHKTKKKKGAKRSAIKNFDVHDDMYDMDQTFEEYNDDYHKEKEREYFENLSKKNLEKLNYDSDLMPSRNQDSRPRRNNYDNYELKDMDIEAVNMPSPSSTISSSLSPQIFNQQFNNHSQTAQLGLLNQSNLFNNPAFLLSIIGANFSNPQSSLLIQSQLMNSSQIQNSIAGYYPWTQQQNGYLNSHSSQSNSVQQPLLISPPKLTNSSQFQNHNYSNKHLFNSQHKQISPNVNTNQNITGRTFNKKFPRPGSNKSKKFNSNLKEIKPNQKNNFKDYPKQKQNNNFKKAKNIVAENDVQDQEQDAKSEVKFTLSSGESSTVSPNETKEVSLTTNQIATFNTNGIDLDERFLDKTTTSMDVDYRQLSTFTNNESSNIPDEKLIQTMLGNINEKFELYTKNQRLNEKEKSENPEPVTKTIEQKEIDTAKEEEEDEEAENEEAMLELRKKLLDTVKQKRLLKKQQEDELKQQEQQIDQDISMLKKKLIQQEQALMINDQKNEIKKQNSMVQNGSFVKSKLLPIIIRIKPNESSDDDDEAIQNKTKTMKPLNKSLEENIGLFLKEAKQLANSAESKFPTDNITNNNKRKLSPVSIESNSTQVKKLETQMDANITNDLEKKDVIKTLRDKINLKSKMIVELTKRSNDLHVIQTKKDKDTDLTRLKINMLKEQLQAAEKILAVNEQSLEEVKAEKRLIDLKLTKIQHMKKNQQEMLQKVLSSPNISNVTRTVIQSEQTSSLYNQKTVNNKLTQPINIVNPKPKSPETTEKSSEQENIVQQAVVNVLPNSPPASTKLLVEQSTLLDSNSSSKISIQSTLIAQSNESQESLTSISTSIPPPPPSEVPKPPLTNPNEKSVSQDIVSAAIQKNLPPKPRPSLASTILTKLPPRMTLGAVVAATAGSSSSIAITKNTKDKSNISHTSSFKNSISSKSLINAPQSSSSSLFTMTRPNLYTSKSTNTKLEQLANKQQSFNFKNQSQIFNENIVVNAKVVNLTPTGNTFKSNTNNNNNINSKNQKLTIDLTKIESKKNELQSRQKLNECLDNLTHDYPYVHSDSFDVWSNESILPLGFKDFKQPCLIISNDILDTSSEISLTKPSTISINKVLTSSNFCNLNECEEKSILKQSTNEIHIIDDVSNYESPLKVFRGYRFSSNFAQFNQFEESYSKFYCNAIDFRRPFCPFDLHGSCKDSNCIYQHTNIMTMDNFQRTEHFLSYCPQLLELSSEFPTKREAIKKLKNYAKTFMNNNLNRMSIKDYFKYLYDHVVENLKLEPAYSTILSRLPILCLNNNKSIGVFDHLEFENDSECADEKVNSLNSQQMIKLNSNQGTSSFSEFGDQLNFLLELILNVNMKRSLEAKLTKLLINSELELEWLKNNQDASFENQDEIVLVWIYFAKQVYTTSNSNQIEKLLNVLSHSLESNSKSELLWLLYLKCYLFKNNSLNDYHEICMLCMDNLITYDLVWFILNTCPFDYIHLIFERYEKYLLNVNKDELLTEFEQSIDVDNLNLTNNDRVSFYLFEMIVYDTYLKLILTEINSEKKEAISTLNKYLNSSQTVSKLEPNDLSLLWLCLIHLEAFLYLPNWLNLSSLTNKISKSVEYRSFWHFDKKRNFNRNLFNGVNFMYKNRLFRNENSSRIQRQFDIFLIPWKQQSKYSCSLDKLQKLFHEALKSINTRCPANSTSSLITKQEIRFFSLPLFINMINLEVSNKRFEIASKFCDRLLQSVDAKMIKELWISLIYIQKVQQQQNNSSCSLVEETIVNSLKMFPNDAQIVYIASQYYASINDPIKSIELIEDFIYDLYFGKSRQVNFSISNLFRHLLRLDVSKKSLGLRESKITSKEYELNNLDHILNIKDQFEIRSNLLNIAVCYCYYLQLKDPERNNFDYICDTFEKLIKNFKIINFKTVLWIRYFKYVYCSANFESESFSNLVLNLIKKCINDLNQISKLNQNNLIPFNYFPCDKNSTLASHNYLNDNKLDIDNSSLYYSFNNEANVELVNSSIDAFSTSNNNNINNNSISNYYYHNCIVDLLIRLFARSPNEKFHLTKFLVDLMPSNSDLVKLFVSFNYKLNGLHKTLQTFYDHLTINSIDNEHLWVLCIKLCLDMNDLQQAVLIYHKAEMMCSKQKKITIELKRISTYLFPSMNESDIL